MKEDGFPLCKMCHRRVAAKDGTTSNMLNHLRRHHPAEYEEVKVTLLSDVCSLVLHRRDLITNR